MTWCVTRLDDVCETGDGAHIHPAYELHTISPDCFCRPKRLENIEVYPIWLHRDELERTGPADPEPS